MTNSNTRNIGEDRKRFLRSWFDQLKTSNDWKKYIRGNGLLKVADARRDAGKKAKGSAFNDDYFKDPHWSYEYRIDFEKWVKEQLRLRDDTDLFGNISKENLGVPLWLEDLDLPKEAIKYIWSLAKENNNLKGEKKQLEARINKLENKLLGLKTMQYNIDDRHDAIESHREEGNIRSLHINIGADMDLSKDDFIELLKRP